MWENVDGSALELHKKDFLFTLSILPRFPLLRTLEKLLKERKKSCNREVSAKFESRKVLIGFYVERYRTNLLINVCTLWPISARTGNRRKTEKKRFESKENSWTERELLCRIGEI